MPKDTNLLAREIVRIATGEAEPELPKEPLSPIQEAARLMGKKGGVAGGKKRAQNMSYQQLSEAGQKAARARWSHIKQQRATTH
ncbi:MAG: histone H1 [Acidobacteria bacterium]|nr:histone H1 [Acidobacteriota bacterium]